MKTTLSRRSFSTLWLSATLLPLTLGPLSKSLAAESPMYELRIYTTPEGRLPDLLTRFRDHTCRLFEKHGIRNVGYWVPLEESDGASNTLIYLVSHPSREAAREAWAAFSKDPEWRAAAQASEQRGKLLLKKPESIFLKPTDYSCPIQPGAASSERVFELRTYTSPEGKLEALHKRFRDHTLALFSKYQMTHIGYWTPVEPEADAKTKLVYILSHPSKSEGLEAFRRFRADPEWIAAKTKSEAEGSLTIQPDGVKSVYMKATDFSPIR